MRKIISLIFIIIGVTSAVAQRADYGKMSAMVRQIARQELSGSKVGQRQGIAPRSPRMSHAELCAFVRISGDGGSVLREHGCRELAREDDIYIVAIPLNRLSALSLDPRVERIEAGPSARVQNDSAAVCINVKPVYEGLKLPQAYTGKGVVVGVEDIGFDLTHPNFFDATGQHYRIKRFWDQLSVDTLDYKLFVGRDYTTEAEILEYAHSRDGLSEGHGTHTLGSAAGSGAGTKYRGIAFESDICAVSNLASAEGVKLLAEEDLYKYTYATDVLGFKYMFDYAKSQGMPCVVSFSEGSGQDLRGDDVLYNEMLRKITGQGRIFVASAGNEGGKRRYLHKAAGEESAGAFIENTGMAVGFTFQSGQPLDLRLVAYGGKNDTLIVSTDVLAAYGEDPYTDTLRVNDRKYAVDVLSFPSCYVEGAQAFDVYVSSEERIGAGTISVELMGREADAELFVTLGKLSTNSRNKVLDGGEYGYSILSPGCTPVTICVGAVGYRQKYENYKGNTQTYSSGINGSRASYSSIGPTFDGRIKPDVVAPGTNIVSSWSSYYIAENPTNDNDDVIHFEQNGRIYGWRCESGTSMSTPIVAGAIALWLQAQPKLSAEDILEVLSRTCTHYDESLTYPNNEYGYGQIDVYRGLLDVLTLTGIEGLSQHQPERLDFSLSGRRLSLVADGELTGEVGVAVYSVSGQLVRRVRLSAGDRSVDLSGLPAGVYAVQVNAASAQFTGSTLVRLQ